MEQKSDKAPRPQAAFSVRRPPRTGGDVCHSINSLLFDGQSLRIEFGVSRVDEMKQNAPTTGRRYPACRLVLTPMAAIELINRMQQIASAMVQAGVVKPGQAGTMPTSAGSP